MKVLGQAAPFNMLTAGSQTDSTKPNAPARETAKNIGFESLDLLFREHYRGIFGVAYRITGNQSDAEDVLQTIFVRLTPRWTELDLSPNPRAFLYRAAINASLDVVRRRRRINSVSLDVLDPDHSPVAHGGPANVLEDAELRELVRQAVAKLEGRA